MWPTDMTYCVPVVILVGMGLVYERHSATSLQTVNYDITHLVLNWY